MIYRFIAVIDATEAFYLYQGLSDDSIEDMS